MQRDTQWQNVSRCRSKSPSASVRLMDAIFTPTRLTLGSATEGAAGHTKAESRGTLDRLPSYGRRWLGFDCAECGKPCKPGQDGERHTHRASVVMTVSTHGTRHLRNTTAIKPSNATREGSGESANASSSSRPIPWSLDPAASGSRADADCDTVLHGMSRSLVVGSLLLHHLSGPSRKRRRRAKKKEAWLREVWRPVVFERDGWICQLCGDLVDPDAKNSRRSMRLTRPHHSAGIRRRPFLCQYAASTHSVTA